MQKLSSVQNSSEASDFPWALITGCAKRIGRAIAIALAHQQYNIIIHYHHADQEAKSLAESIHALGCKTLMTSMDLTQVDQVSGWCEDLIKQTGKIDLVINNASIFIENNIEQVRVEDMYRDINLHAITPLLIAQKLKAYKQPQHIINMLDAGIYDPKTNYLSYSLSKQMLKHITLMLAKSLAPLTRVNAICPGPVLAPPEKSEDKNYLSNKIAQVLLSHVDSYASLEKDNLNAICEAVHYLNQSKQTTGQILMVDRGQHLL